MEAVIAAAMPHVQVLDVELDQPAETVRLFIDASGGVSHELCAMVTKAVRDTCPQLSLEVSSPGIERPLRSSEHFRAAVGSRIRLRRRGVRRPFTAVLVQVGEGSISVRREDDSELQVPLDEIVRSHLVVDAPADTKAAAGANQRGRGSR